MSICLKSGYIYVCVCIVYVLLYVNCKSRVQVVHDRVQVKNTI